MVAISSDSLESHRRFCEALGGCLFPVASDPDLTVARLYGTVDEAARRSRRAVFVLDEAGMVILKVPWYQPGNMGQFMEVFQALGVM